jgi:hypothetical protein
LCTGGMYCDNYGLEKPSGLCSAGYFCSFGSNSSTPSSTTSSSLTQPNADRCPLGHYCPQGTADPLPCPAGRYGPSIGARSLQDCLGCPPGFFCFGLGNTKPTGSCTAGYFCEGYAASRTQNESLPGHYSSAGASSMSPCLPGTYNSLHRSSNCTTCPAGYYCPNNAMAAYDEFRCPAGAYCPRGSSDVRLCPAGTYNAHEGMGAESDCYDCPPGHFCEGSGLTQPSGPCAEGYYCSGAAEYRTQEAVTATGGPCSLGHYCPRGSVAPVQCPIGTYMNSLRATGNVTFGGKTYFCLLCPPGMACPSLALVNPVATCSEGYFCSLGAPSTKPICSDSFCSSMFGSCPAGYFCPADTVSPRPCRNGTYSAEEGAGSCVTCPAGSYCASNVNNSPKDCPQVITALCHLFPLHLTILRRAISAPAAPAPTGLRAPRASMAIGRVCAKRTSVSRAPRASTAPRLLSWLRPETALRATIAQ